MTREIREAVKFALDAQGDKLSGWFDAVAGEDPGRALALYGQLAEYAAPKLGRVEMAGDKEAPIVWKFEDDE